MAPNGQTLCGRPLMTSKGETYPKEGSEAWKLWDPKTAIDDRDKDSPDNWIPRHPSLIRLTGKHPLNAEPPHLDLMDAGFITPTSLHFVRNHGATQKVTWEEHRIDISGLVGKPCKLTMDDLLQFPAYTCPVTLVCSGNRRKEVNMVSKSNGFSYGPCAVATNTWTGVRLADVLRYVRVKGPAEGAKWVQCTGPKGELPKGDDGSYGTCMLLSYAMDPANDVMLAYKQNGQFLHPDHGFPVRIVIPGWIAGRMVKWLSYISVTREDTTNFYHYHDNKIMPPHVTNDIADAEGWWFKPEYFIWDHSINSTISRPAHDERVFLDLHNGGNVPYTMEGYAYSGGGRKIQRVEVTLDDGKTWKLCDLKITEKPNMYGKYWCWIHWSLQVTTFDFFTAPNVMCRAYDHGQNTQPMHLTWSLLGQGNNSMFKLQLHKERDAQGRLCLRFQQPAPMLPGELGNVGWLEEEKLARDAAARDAAAPPPETAVPTVAKKVFTMKEVAKHNTEESAWFVHEGKVYDGTPYLEDHPGGGESIILAAGEDATDEFNAIHSKKARAMLADYYIGELGDAAAPAPPAAAPPVRVAAIKEDVALNPRKKVQVTLKEKIIKSHNVILFRFALPGGPQQKLGLPVGKHFFVYGKWKEENVMRAYTPTTGDEVLGTVDLLVKIYRANEHPKFPDGGKMSQYLESLEPGDTVDIKGPVGHMVYNGHGDYVLNNKLHKKCTKINMIAGGTGITPMYQVMKAITSDPTDKTEVKLLFANQTEDDIMMREDLEAFAEDNANIGISYTLDRPGEGWTGESGFINEEMVRKTLFAPEGDDVITIMCGPPPMLQYACYPNLEKVGFTKEQMITF